VNRLAGGALGLLLALFATPASPAQALDDSQVLARQVHALFAVKCVECHGADLERPKGRFGYVLDLARVAANPKMIVPGKPAQSELYQLVSHNEMPDPKAKKEPLTRGEKDIVKRWIEAGAPADLSAGNAAAALPLTFW
jgi:mono/diheme cytochrome c family protein